MAGKILYGVK
jgi:hypothetical protein